MTGEELRQMIKNSGMSFTDLAKALDTSPQNLNARLNRRSVKYDFVQMVKSIIDKCCPPLPAEVELAVNGSAINGSHSPNVNQTVGGDAALIAENKLLREQNEYLQKQLDRCMAKLLGN